MSWAKSIFVVILLIAILSFICFYTLPKAPKEGFEIQKIQEEIELDTVLRKAADSICPVYEKFLTQTATMIDSTNPTSAEAKSAAIAELVKQAGGLLFPCPIPEDVLATPADIGVRTSRAITYFDKTLTNMIGQIESALSNCPKEGFEDICTADQMKQRAAAAAAAVTATCKPPTEVSVEDKILILKTRKEALSRVLDDPAMAELLKGLPGKIQKLEGIKKQAEEGTLKMNCGSSPV